MSHFEQTDLIINAAKPVSFNEKAVRSVIEDRGIIAQEKLDGVRYHLVITPGEPLNGKPTGRGMFISRSHKVIPSLASMFDTEAEQLALGAFLTECRHPDGIVIDGEVIVKGLTFQKSSGRLRKKEPLKASELNTYVYGVLELVPLLVSKSASVNIKNSVMDMTVEATLTQLNEFLPEFGWVLPETHYVYTFEELEGLYERVRGEGGEGLVLKDPMDIWKRGKKVGWWKMKPEDTVDGIVVGVNWGTEGLANEGLVIGFQVKLETGHIVNANGITQAQMQEFTANVKSHGTCNTGCQYTRDVGMLEHSCSGQCRYDYHNDNNPYQGWYCQVRFMELTDDGSLRHPSFDGWRGMEGSEKEKA